MATEPPRRVALPLGRGTLSLTLPESWSVTRATPGAAAPLPDLAAAAREAIRHPLGAGDRLRDRARPGARVTVVITDATRPSPDAVFLPLLREELALAGVRDKDITVLVALGMHRPSTEAERREKLGDLFGVLRVEDAQGGRLDEYVDLGVVEPATTSPRLPVPVPVHLHRRVVDCDLLIATGVVEPHQYAGFSGGRKTVAVGCASRRTIGILHGLAFLKHPGTRLGLLDANPVHAALVEIGRRVRLAFSLNVALDAGGRPVAVAAGDPETVLETLVERLAPVAWVPVGAEPFDAVLAGVGAPKDANLYQASRALTYLVFSPRPPMRDGAWVLLAASCDEGAGQGPGEEEFLARMQGGGTPAEILERLRREGFGAGGQRAVMVAKALQRNPCLLVGPRDGGTLAAACHMAWAADGDAAVAELRRRIGDHARVLVVEHALATLPVLGS